MNAINPWAKGPRVFMRSLATREAGNELSKALPDVVAACKCAGFDLVVVETSGIGQGDAAIVPLVDASLYVMTPEYGAASQLEKIDMLDFADFVAINKFDRKGAADALRDVAKQVQRNRQAFDRSPDTMPVFGTMAARFNDDGVTALYQALLAKLKDLGLKAGASRLPVVATRHSTNQTPILPPAALALPRGHRGHGARVQVAGEGAVAHRPRAPEPRRDEAHAGRALLPRARRHEPEGRRDDRHPGRRARGEARSRARGSCWRCGRRCARRTPATSTW